MAEPKAQGEQDPSMEEILQSIRRIIAEDDKKDDPKTAANANSAGVEFSSDVLELTEMVQDDGSLLSINPPPANAPVNTTFGHMDAVKLGGASLDVLANIDDALAQETTFGTMAAPKMGGELEERRPPPPREPPASAYVDNMPEDSESLLTDQTAASSVAALKKLDQARPQEQSYAPGTPSMQFRGGHTVEDLVLEALRPMLKEWLNANLPGIVERIVDREVKKISGS